VRLNHDEQLAHVSAVVSPKCTSEYDALPRNANETTAPYQWHHAAGFMAPLDFRFLYCALRTTRPRRVVEIGSGMSTLLTATALRRNNADEQLEYKMSAQQASKDTGGEAQGTPPPPPAPPANFTAIEPFPNSLIEAGGIPGLTRLLVSKVEDVDLSVFRELQAGDVLFIDSSHVFRMGGDVHREILNVLPSLRKGVRVHVHDILLPRHYTRSMYAYEGRMYTEQYFLQAFLAYSTSFAVEYAASWLFEESQPALCRAFRVDGASKEGQDQPDSFWMVRTREPGDELGMAEAPPLDVPGSAPVAASNGNAAGQQQPGAWLLVLSGGLCILLMLQ
jgi:hypothetical protein